MEKWLYNVLYKYFVSIRLGFNFDVNGVVFCLYYIIIYYKND